MATSSSCCVDSRYSRDNFMCINKSIVLFSFGDIWCQNHPAFRPSGCLSSQLLFLATNMTAQSWPNILHGVSREENNGVFLGNSCVWLEAILCACLHDINTWSQLRQNLNHCPHCVSVRGWMTGEPALVTSLWLSYVWIGIPLTECWPALLLYLHWSSGTLNLGALVPYSRKAVLQVTQEDAHPNSSQYTCLDPECPYLLLHHPCQARVCCGPVTVRRPSSSSQWLGCSNKVINLPFSASFPWHSSIHLHPFIYWSIHTAST